MFAVSYYAPVIHSITQIQFVMLLILQIYNIYNILYISGQYFTYNFLFDIF